MGIRNTAKHYHNRKLITDVAKSLRTRNLDYEEAMIILKSTYKAMSHFHPIEYREVIFDETIRINELKDGITDELVRPVAKKILEDDLSDIVLSDLVRLAFPTMLSVTTIKPEDKETISKIDNSILGARSHWTTTDFNNEWGYSIVEGLLIYYSWIETTPIYKGSEYTNVIKYLKIPNAMTSEANYP